MSYSVCAACQDRPGWHNDWSSRYGEHKKCCVCWVENGEEPDLGHDECVATYERLRNR